MLVRHLPRLVLVLAVLVAVQLTVSPVGPAVAADCVVTSTADSGAGSLREKLADSTCSSITFALPGNAPWTIALASDLPTVARQVSVTGPGVSGLTVDRGRACGTALVVLAGGDLTLAGLSVAGSCRLVVAGGRATLDDTAVNGPGGVSVSGGSLALDDTVVTGANTGVQLYGGSATLRNAVVSGNGDGVQVLHGGSLTLTATTVASNAHAGLEADDAATVSVTGSTFRDNGQYDLLVDASTATVTDSSFSSLQHGMSVSGPGGAATVTGSTFTDPSGVYATGIAVSGGATVAVTNSTITRTAVGVTAGPGGSATVTNSTLANFEYNLATAVGGTATLTNTLLAVNPYANCAAGSTVVNGGHNLADDSTCFADGTNGSRVVPRGRDGLDPAGLTDNGGPTETIALTPTSPAVKAGDAAVCAATGPGHVNGLDQRGMTRHGARGCDIGAYESAWTCQVTTTAESGAGSLREALSDPGCDAIGFALPGGAPSRILLTRDLPVTRTVSVTGPGAADLTIATTGSAVFDVRAGRDLTLRGLTVTGASRAPAVTAPTGSHVTLTEVAIDVPTGGGGVLSSGVRVEGGSVRVTDSTFTSSCAGTCGVGVAGVAMVTGGTATVTGSTFDHLGVGVSLGRSSHSSAAVTGSTFRQGDNGLSLGTGTRATVSGSTFSGHTYADVSLNGGDLAVADSTFVGSNLAFGQSGTGSASVVNSTFVGGVVAGFYGRLTLANSLLANPPGRGGPLCSRPTGISNAGHNLADDASCFPDSANGSRVVTRGQAGLDPGGLRDNGGPTQTVALAVGSPAVDAADAAVCAASGNGEVNGVDQRGVPRPQGAGCDIGAYELVPSTAAATSRLPAPAGNR